MWISKVQNLFNTNTKSSKENEPDSKKKLIHILHILSRYFLQAGTNSVIHGKDPIRTRQRAIEITADNSRKLLHKLDVQVQVHSNGNPFTGSNYFMVCNHMSYFDILVLTSIQPAVFISSLDMEKTFFLGKTAKLGGTFFVNRVNHRKLKEEVRSLMELMNHGFHVFLFPEGTSTNGLDLAPFKKSLFRVPYQTGFPILPVCLKYVSIDGKPFSRNNCDRICWYGKMKFAPHVLQLLAIRELKVEVHYLKSLNPKDFNSHGDLSQTVENQIRSVYFSANPTGKT